QKQFHFDVKRRKTPCRVQTGSDLRLLHVPPPPLQALDWAPFANWGCSLPCWRPLFWPLHTRGPQNLPHPISGPTSTFSLPALRSAKSRPRSTRSQPSKFPTSSEPNVMPCSLSPAPTAPARLRSIFRSATTPAWQASASLHPTS